MYSPKDGKGQEDQGVLLHLDDDSDKGSKTDEDDLDDDDFLCTVEKIDDRRKKTQIRREARDTMFKESEDEVVIRAKYDVPQWIELLVDQTTQSWGNAIRANHNPLLWIELVIALKNKEEVRAIKVLHQLIYRQTKSAVIAMMETKTAALPPTDVRRKTVRISDAKHLDQWRKGHVPELDHKNEAGEGADVVLPKGWLSGSLRLDVCLRKERLAESPSL